MSDLPLVWANYFSIAGFVFLLFLVWMIPKRLIYKDAVDMRPWRDIRIWATVLISIQITLYLIFN